MTTKFLIPSEEFIPFTGFINFAGYTATQENLWDLWLEYLEFKKQAGEKE
jgi:hypothetical protein